MICEMNRITCNFGTKWSQAQKIVGSSFHTKIYPHQKDVKNCLPTLDFTSEYNEETTERVLHVLNNTTDIELSRYDITKTRASKVVKYRHNLGPFTSMEQVLNVDNFGVKVLEKLVSSIAQNSTAKEVPDSLVKISTKLLNHLSTPTLEDVKRSTIKTLTGIIIEREHISWTNIDSSGNLLTWDTYDKCIWPKRDEPMVLHRMALEVQKRLPESDIYVTEIDLQPRYRTPISLASLLYGNQRIRLTGMLAALVATQFDCSDGSDAVHCRAVIDNFYYLKRELPASLFQLYIGSEIIAARGVAEQIISDTIPKSLEYIPPINVDSLEYNVYDKSCPGKKEALSRTLLLSIAFMQLGVKREPRCLEAVRLKSSKKCN